MTVTSAVAVQNWKETGGGQAPAVSEQEFVPPARNWRGGLVVPGKRERMGREIDASLRGGVRWVKDRHPT